MPEQDKPWYRKWWGLALGIFASLILAVFLALGFYIFQNFQTIKNNPTAFSYKLPEISEAERNLIEGAGAYRLGPDTAKITIVEFGDYACPYCQQSFGAIRRISREYSGQVRYIFRDYPVVAEHSPLLALAANCAGEQGLFWPMHDKLFINYGVNNRAEVLSLARQIGADEKRFTVCLDNEKHLPLVRKSLADAKALGVRGTPAWFINGQKLEGLIPEANFREIIETFLAND